MKIMEAAWYSRDGDLWWCGVELSGETVMVLLKSDVKPVEFL